MSKLTNELPGNIKVAGTGKRTGAFLLDALFGILLGVGVYFAFGRTVILKSAGYEQAVTTYNEKAIGCGIAYADSNGNATQISLEAGDKSSWKETLHLDIPDGSYSYVVYETVVWNYYYKALGQTDGNTLGLSFQDGEFSSTLEKTSDEYKTSLGKWIYMNVFSFTEDKLETTYFKCKDGDYTKMPALSDSYQAKVDSAVTETRDNALGDLHEVFDNSTDSTSYGMYQKAILNFNSRDVIVNATNTATKARTLALLPSTAGAPLIFFVLVPLLLKGKTLGKKILGLTLIGKDGFAAKPLNCVIHHGLIGLVFELLCLPYYTIIIPVIGIIFVIDFVMMSISKNARSLHDRIAMTYVADAKNSQIFANQEEMDSYIDENPESSIARYKRAQEAEARASSYVTSEAEILDLSTINRNREEARNITDFNEFEKENGLDDVELGSNELPSEEVPSEETEIAEETVAEEPKEEKAPERPLDEDGFTDEQ